MVTPEEVKAMALSFDGADEKSHFNRIAFTVKKKIFAILSYEDKTLNLMFTPQIQFIYCPAGSNIIFPVPNKWGEKGATTINLDKASKKLVLTVLKEAYELRKGK